MSSARLVLAGARYREQNRCGDEGTSMAMSKSQRWIAAASSVLVVLVVIAFGLLQYAQREVKARVVAA
jgi:hypothetical protein